MRFREHMQAVGRDYFTAMLIKHHGNVTRVSRESGINRTNLYRVLKRYKVEVPRFGIGRKPLILSSAQDIQNAHVSSLAWTHGKRSTLASQDTPETTASR